MKIITAAIFAAAFFAQAASAAGTCYSYTAYDDPANDVRACLMNVSYNQATTDARVAANTAAAPADIRSYDAQNEYAAAI